METTLPVIEMNQRKSTWDLTYKNFMQQDIDIHKFWAAVVIGGGGGGGGDGFLSIVDPFSSSDYNFVYTIEWRKAIVLRE